MDALARRTLTMRVPLDGRHLTGDLTLPPNASGIVLFAHGSGSSRFSPRNRQVARSLAQRGMATLLIDLLTPDEESVDQVTGQIRFDIGLLARRLVTVIDWLEHYPPTRPLTLGLFGASTGAGAALVAAAERPHRVHAVVSRGGRPDLAGAALPRVIAPTLLIVGDLDTAVVALNNAAMLRMSCEVSLELVPGATHLFEEPGTLERVADLAGRFLETHLAGA